MTCTILVSSHPNAYDYNVRRALSGHCKFRATCYHVHLSRGSAKPKILTEMLWGSCMQTYDLAVLV